MLATLISISHCIIGGCEYDYMTWSHLAHVCEVLSPSRRACGIHGIRYDIKGASGLGDAKLTQLFGVVS